MKPIHILLVEDNEGDVLLTTEALYESNLPFTLFVVKDGREATLLLGKKDKYADEAMPDLVILDLNLPKLNGIEVLKNIKTNEETRHIPVIMLSTSAFEKDIKLCLQLEACCFMTKPLETDVFCQQVEGLKGITV
ncbi:response regulator [Ferruginibacter paludis]|uniref:response regulator n=1 Tax=Ferruginibacter paludis TaxID=1310417 RepID=UPI0025B48226|nr:response regulator [Ferruginibacter paludis]MDN3654666.1 response regulator [Ferruginibacter paludis]